MWKRQNGGRNEVAEFWGYIDLRCSLFAYGSKWNNGMLWMFVIAIVYNKYYQVWMILNIYRNSENHEIFWLVQLIIYLLYCTLLDLGTAVNFML